MQAFLQTVSSALRADPLTLSILFVGLTSMGAIWIAALAIKKGTKGG